MRVTIKAVKVPAGGWSVTVVDYATNKSILDKPRQLGEVVDAEGRLFPVPPAGEPDTMPGDVPAADIGTYFDSVMGQAGDPDGVARLGRYLFRTLLARDLWERILAAAPAEEPIELALTWDADSPLHRLPWEVMHTGTTGESVREGFLAHQPGLLFTRRVPGTTAQRFKIKQLPSPPRVLVVVGSPLNDARIRPGAEYLGLLRALRDAQQSLNTRLVVEATASKVSRAVAQFEPNVVHIIGHGVSGPAVLFRGEEGEPADYAVDAARLIQILTIDDTVPLPNLVVLNACSPDLLDEVTFGRPMAAELVKGGIPIVVGMSGNVADQACRVFTRKFYSALLDGTEIATAASRGRRAGIANGGYDAESQIDWGLPALFMGEVVGPVSIDTNAPNPDLDRLTTAGIFVDEPKYPVFCGRWEFFSQFRELISSSIEDMTAPHLFVIPVPRQDPTPPYPPGPQYGSERLLREFAAETIRYGHIPILLSKGFLAVPHKQWPNELDEFLQLYFVKAVDETIQILSGIPPLEPLRASPRLENLGRLKPALFEQPPDGPLPDEIRFINDPAQRLAAAIFSDLLALREKVCQLRGIDQKTADVKVVLLIEDYHDFEYGDVLAELFRRFGLKDKPARGITRAVVTFNRIPTDSQPTTTTVIKDFTASASVITRDLTALHSPITATSKPAEVQEAALVYRQFLMGWQDRETPTPLSLWSRGDKDTTLMETFSEITSGWPSEIAGRALWATILTLVRQRSPELRPANDEDVLTAESAMPRVREG